MTRNALFIVYNFPPVGGSGTIRVSKFVKYLPEFGWQPHILTVPASLAVQQDNTLFTQLPPEVRVHRASCLDPRVFEKVFRGWWTLLWKMRLRWLAQRMQPYLMMQWLMLPDPLLTWVNPAVSLGRRIVEEYQIEALFSSALPASTHLVGQRLQSKCKLPWIADYRDQWTQNPFLEYVTPWHKSLNTRMEKNVLTAATRVVGVSETMCQELHAITPLEPEEKFVCIPNGYDPADFSEISSPPLPSKHFRIAHIGNLYGARSPKPFLIAWDELVKNRDLPEDGCEVCFVGKAEHPDMQPYLDRPWLKILPSVSHREALRIMSFQDVLLLLTHEQAFDTIPAKVFEYLASRRPILALVTPGTPSEQLLKAAECDTIAPLQDIFAIRCMILKLYTRWQAGNYTWTPKPVVLAQHNRKHLTEKLASILNSLT